MDKLSLPLRGAGWRTDRGRLGIWLPCSTVLVVGLHEHGDAEFVQPIISAYERLSSKDALHLFFDAEMLTSYDTSLRTQLTTRFLSDRKQIAAFHVLVGSPMVKMGMSVVNLAARGFVQVTGERLQLKEQLDAVLFRERASGFSSNVLDTFAGSSVRSLP